MPYHILTLDFPVGHAPGIFQLQNSLMRPDELAAELFKRWLEANRDNDAPMRGTTKSIKDFIAHNTDGTFYIKRGKGNIKNLKGSRDERGFLVDEGPFEIYIKRKAIHGFKQWGMVIASFIVNYYFSDAPETLPAIKRAMSREEKLARRKADIQAKTWGACPNCVSPNYPAGRCDKHTTPEQRKLRRRQRLDAQKEATKKRVRKKELEHLASLRAATAAKNAGKAPSKTSVRDAGRAERRTRRQRASLAGISPSELPATTPEELAASRAILVGLIGEERLKSYLVLGHTMSVGGQIILNPPAF